MQASVRPDLQRMEVSVHEPVDPGGSCCSWQTRIERRMYVRR